MATPLLIGAAIALAVAGVVILCAHNWPAIERALPRWLWLVELAVGVSGGVHALALWQRGDRWSAAFAAAVAILLIWAGARQWFARDR